MNWSDTGWLLHTGHETKRWTDRRTGSGQAVVKDKKGKSDRREKATRKLRLKIQ